MKTIIIKINPKRPEADKIREAAAVVKRGGILVFPTETVYGLGCNALDKKAVAKIFRVKKRDRGKPLLILIGGKNDWKKLARKVPLAAKKLMNKYWPGPLTLVLEKSSRVPAIVTARKKKVAIRFSSSRIVRALVRRSGVPLIGTSANLAGKKSFCRPADVVRQFEGKVDLIIDGGNAPLGIESTVLDAAGRCQRILRQGAVKPAINCP